MGTCHILPDIAARACVSNTFRWEIHSIEAYGHPSIQTSTQKVHSAGYADATPPGRRHMHANCPGRAQGDSGCARASAARVERGLTWRSGPPRYPRAQARLLRCAGFPFRGRRTQCASRDGHIPLLYSAAHVPLLDHRSIIEPIAPCGAGSSRFIEFY